MTETGAPIATVTLENAAEKLRDQIRSAFVELIPPEQWKAMVENELKSFTMNSVNRYGDKTPSELSHTCRKVFNEFVQAEIHKILNGPDFQADYTSDGVSRLIKQWLTENQASLIQTAIQVLAGAAAQSIVDSMSRSGG